MARPANVRQRAASSWAAGRPAPNRQPDDDRNQQRAGAAIAGGQHGGYMRIVVRRCEEARPVEAEPAIDRGQRIILQRQCGRRHEVGEDEEHGRDQRQLQHAAAQQFRFSDDAAEDAAALGHPAAVTCQEGGCPDDDHAREQTCERLPVAVLEAERRDPEPDRVHQQERRDAAPDDGGEPARRGAAGGEQTPDDAAGGAERRAGDALCLRRPWQSDQGRCPSGVDDREGVSAGWWGGRHSNGGSALAVVTGLESVRERRATLARPL